MEEYFVSEDRIKEKYESWKNAMLLELSSSLNLPYDINNTIDFEIDSVLKFNLLLSGITGLLHTRFRGEARYHSNPCLPIIARGDTSKKSHQFEIEEIMRFKQSQTAQRFKNQLASTDITWWMLTQHYNGYQTRLIDISRNAHVALYFACERHPDKDGYVFILHSLNKNSRELNPNYKSFSDHIQDNDDYYLEDSFVYMRPNFSLYRIDKQEGEFLWVKDYNALKTRGLFESNQVIPILIKSRNKAKILKELDDPHGINEISLNLDREY